MSLREEVKWKFPCKGINKVTNLIVGFSKDKEGVVLNVGNSTYNTLYEYSEFWIMNDFEPLEEEKQPLDWHKIEYPIWARDKERIIIITDISDDDPYPVVCHASIYNNGKVDLLTQSFDSILERNEWLNSLEILPKGTQIEIIL